ncbi:hypothetical protein K431DRAFT_284063 [Polychaeton citri CBS 116435]|uniref:Uncharacterized protein n=1 Tax=Polychaeton citri CBS 116435 TaxID=1314669 RepID=A0A9P4URB0_9PEZI|nr:hypothetical protein K431DRAFT_284063 [Polychaeton citri CBS 116435]
MAPGTSPTQSPVPIMKQENGPTFDDILLRLSTNSVSATPLGNTGSAHQQQTNMGEDTVSPTEIAKPNVEDLAHCTERRRRRSSGLIPSPLASHLPADLYHSSPGNPDRMEVDEEFPSPDSAAAAPGQHSHMPASGYVRTSSVSESMIESLGKDIRKGFETLRGQLGIGPSKTYDQHLHRNYADQVHAVNMSEPMEDVRPTFTAATSLRGVKTSRRGQERS